MSSSTLPPRFLIDENVRIELYLFLKKEGYDVRVLSKGAPDSLLVETSRKEKRVLVTNDSDFRWYPNHKIYAVVWLKIPQNEVGTLIRIFNKLIKALESFSGKLIILRETDWDEKNLFTALASPSRKR
ncbi:hypothetical protein A2630_03110 [Candidatus Woesebacteria bacterium RIFCSPHIGHO2_01_FULL_44_10]|uniref:DUF5615 domain-containing protein n=1 Tax=Candidatus Woesebacteria bacterium RIFCSPLOWO2_01_FULL_44_14 TaxID=1802525 RepID=A0A1F8BY04_9BACT|nr:MAG: hypothetical protein A2630_03110 [Candidatus Woesebacteria bacterium RIFCSPHIGHO2_01_FULL_44_10]OGM56315.1 MAG: hypothetical protein A3F62_05015 [Candidatus Woesebacteria bacterium RIFCSPHIGHO2_12_FULL_44_11]OGM68770.1 MAG: hypothetical protein A2975_02855 [Candidatus Woesebacteria bacterium RIFCSPLOWO2_01_FULL_44_14]